MMECQEEDLQMREKKLRTMNAQKKLHQVRQQLANLNKEKQFLEGLEMAPFEIGLEAAKHQLVQYTMQCKEQKCPRLNPNRHNTYKKHSKSRKTNRDNARK
jgi:hypothetical protein